MNVTFDWAYLVGAAIAVVGVLEWIKGFAPVTWPSWVWRVVMAPICVVVAIAGDGGVFQIATNSFALIAISQIGYPVLIQLPTAIIQAFRNKIGV